MNESDPLEDLLGPDSHPAREVSFRRELRAKTSRTIRYLPWRRKLKVATAVFLFAAGFLLFAWLNFPGEDGAKPQVSLVPELLIVGGAENRVREPSEKPGTALQQEWHAFDQHGQEKPAGLVEAGKRYLEEENDYAAALRCYSHALEVGDERFRKVAPQDDWLMTALKFDR